MGKATCKAIYAVLALGKHFTSMEEVIFESEDCNEAVLAAQREEITGKWLWTKIRVIRYEVARQ